MILSLRTLLLTMSMAAAMLAVAAGPASAAAGGPKHCFETAGDDPRIAVVRFDLTFDVMRRTVTGSALVTSSTQQALEPQTGMRGRFRVGGPLPLVRRGQIRMVAVGGPVSLLDAVLTFDGDWREGTGEIQYLAAMGDWVSLEGTPIHAVSCAAD